MLEGCDYSSTRPNPICLRHAFGHAFVIRYVGTPGRPKNLTPDEAAALTAQDLELVGVCEKSEGFMVSGYTVGHRAAQEARRDAIACGMPEDRPIYYALDVDPGGFLRTDWGDVVSFLRGAANASGGVDRIGLYGGIEAIERLVPNVAAYGWQTLAWSHGDLSPKAALYQWRNGVQICEGTVDYDRAIHSDYGQWRLVRRGGFLDMLTDAQQTELLKNSRTTVEHLASMRRAMPLRVVATGFTTGDPVYHSDLYSYIVQVGQNGPFDMLVQNLKRLVGFSPRALRLDQAVIDDMLDRLGAGRVGEGAIHDPLGLAELSTRREPLDAEDEAHQAALGELAAARPEPELDDEEDLGSFGGTAVEPGNSGP